jgi:hypothetical protein
VAIYYPFVYEDTQIQEKVVKISQGPTKYLRVKKGVGQELWMTVGKV